MAEAAGETLEEHWLARYLEAPDDFGDRSVGAPGRLISTGTLFETLWRGFLPNAQELDWDLLGDTGLACSLQMISSPKALSGHPLVGSLFETAVVGELRKLSSTLATPPVFYHWRSHGGAEIDVLLERDGRFFPIEVKMTTKPGRDDTSGITAFRKTYPGLNVAPGLVICPVANPFFLNGLDLAFPWNTR